MNLIDTPMYFIPKESKPKPNNNIKIQNIIKKIISTIKKF